MTEMKEQCIYFCGPYKGYCGRAELDLEDDLFHGEVVGVRDVVTFQGRTHGELKTAFRDSVDDYLAFCKTRNESPEKPYSGKFLMRVDPQVHRKLATLAEIAGKSLNQFICDFLTPIAESSPAAMLASPPDKAARQ
jgi:predicted HicB family RNase H-like nuclease